jgi:hypothetical protein
VCDTAVAAGDVVTYTATAVNTGSLQLRNLVFSIPTVNDLSCNYGADAASATTPLVSSTVLELDQVVVCTGTYTFTQVCERVMMWGRQLQGQ